MSLRLPATAFDLLDVPMIRQQPAEDVEKRLLFATRILMIAALSFHRLQRPLDPESLTRQVSTIDGLDAMVIEVALSVLPAEVWQEIEDTIANFGKDAIPKVYQGRDKRLCGLILVLRCSPSDDVELNQLFNGFESACRYEGSYYDAVMANLLEQGVLEDVAQQVLEHLSRRPRPLTLEGAE